jgi:hypothetical protein
VISNALLDQTVMAGRTHERKRQCRQSLLA